jgi:hypothetical protein
LDPNEFVWKLSDRVSDSLSSAKRREDEQENRRRNTPHAMTVATEWLREVVNVVRQSGKNALAVEARRDGISVAWVGLGTPRRLRISRDAEQGWLRWQLLVMDADSKADVEISDEGRVDPRQFQIGLQGPLFRLVSDSQFPPNEEDEG